MQSHEFDISIIGGGCIGSSILYELCRRGIKNIALVDNGRKTMSATANSGGMLRVFHENPEHINLALHNFILLDKYHSENVLTESIVENGNLYFFDKNRYANYTTNLLQMEQAHYPFEILTPDYGKKLFPQYHWNSSWAIYEPRGTQLTTERFIDDLVLASMNHQVNIFNNFEVNNIFARKNCYQIMNEKDSITSKVLILAGGARLMPILKQLGLRFTFEVKKIKTLLANKINLNLRIPNYFDRESLHFGGFSQREHVVISDEKNERIKEKNWENIFAEKSAEDIYAYNRMGLLGKISGYENLFIATGWGGTAFKFALEIGYRVADAVEQNL